MKKFTLALALLLLPLFLFSQDLEQIKRSGRIRAAFQPSSLKDINYPLAQEFAAFLGVELEVVQTDWNENFSLEGILLDNYKTDSTIAYVPDVFKKADFVCNTITILDWRKKFLNFVDISSATTMIVVPENDMTTKNRADLKGKTIAFKGNTIYQTILEQINEDIGGGINYHKVKTNTEGQNLLVQGEVDAVIIDVNFVLEFLKSNKGYKIAFSVAPKLGVGWAVKNGNFALREELINFFETIKGNGKLDELFVAEYGVNYDTYLDIVNAFSEAQNTISDDRDLDEIIASGKLIVALRESEMNYSTDEDDKQLNHILAEEFAKFIGVDFEFVITKNFEDYFKNEDGEILDNVAYTPEWFNHFDVACETMAPTESRQNKIDIIDFLPRANVVVARREAAIHSINDLRNFKGVTAKGTVYEELLIENDITDYTTDSLNYLLDDVVNYEADYTIWINAIYKLPEYQSLEAKFIIGELGKTGWALSKNKPKLKQKILEFIDYAKNTGLLNKHFLNQTGMTLTVAEKYLTILHETSQTGYFPFVSYEADDGLPQEEVLSMFQDKDAYLWFGTYSGAVKYNGKNMTVLDNRHGLNDNIIYDINQDSTGALYFATSKGVSILRKDSVQTIFKNASFRNIFIDKHNNKWFAAKNGIYSLTNNNELKYLNENNVSLPQHVQDVTLDSSGTMYIATSKGLFYMTKDGKVTEVMKDYCNFVFIDKDDNLWFSTNSALFFVADKNPETFSYKMEILNINLGIPLIPIKNIIQTRDGSIWVISEYKVFQILALNQKAIIYDQEIGLRNASILSILEDKEDNMWFGFSGGIQKLTNRTLRNFYPHKINGYVNSVFEDTKGRIWIIAKNGIYHYKESLNIFTDDVSSFTNNCQAAIMPNQNILIANSMGLFEVDVNTLEVIRTREFTQVIPLLEKLHVSRNNEIFIMTGEDGNIHFLESFHSPRIVLGNNATALVSQLVEFDGKIIGANSSGLILFIQDNFKKLINTEYAVWSLCPDDDKLWVGTEGGLGIYKGNSYKSVYIDLPSKVIKSIKQASNKNYLWLGTNQGFAYFNKIRHRIEFLIDAKDGLAGNEIANDGLFVDSHGIVWVPTFHGLTTFDIKKRLGRKSVPISNIESIWINGEQIKLEELKGELSYFQNNLVFELTGISFKDEQSIEYEFFMRGLKNDYSASRGREFKAHYPSLPPGKYEFVYRTKNKDGLWSYYKSVKFEILEPFWVKWWFILLSAAAIVLVIYLIIKWRERNLRKKNERLEEIVEERTREVIMQKEEIEDQSLEINKKNVILGKINQKITDSIEYASRIQSAILPPMEMLSENLPAHFVLFKPKEIVSGDFYWATQKSIPLYSIVNDEKVKTGVKKLMVIAAADCTGHGVPGAFMSMLGATFLNKIVIENNVVEANEILNQLRKNVKDALRQTGKEGETRDGMDISLCVIDTETLKVEFSGAHNPMYIIRNGEIESAITEFGNTKIIKKNGYNLAQIKGNAMPIGISRKERPFTSTNIQLQPGDIFYLFSDGYADQLGGSEGKKYMIKSFKSLLLDLYKKPMNEQKKELEKTMTQWMGEHYNQIDDILIMGIKV